MLLVHCNCTVLAEDTASAFSACGRNVGLLMAHNAFQIFFGNTGFVKKKNHLDVLLDLLPCLSLLCSRIPWLNVWFCFWFEWFLRYIMHVISGTYTNRYACSRRRVLLIGQRRHTYTLNQKKYVPPSIFSVMDIEFSYAKKESMVCVCQLMALLVCYHVFYDKRCEKKSCTFVICVSLYTNNKRIMRVSELSSTIHCMSLYVLLLI